MSVNRSIDSDDLANTMEYIFNLVGGEDTPHSVAFIKLRDSMENDNQTYEFMVRALLGTLHDGLTYGNWPK